MFGDFVSKIGVIDIFWSNLLKIGVIHPLREICALRHANVHDWG